jgi:Spy/CpxP family protein refolding chaperone
MTSPVRNLIALAAAAFAFATFGGVAYAQDVQQQSPPAGAQQHGQRMGQILMSLNLSDAQKAKIKDIVAAARKENEGVTDRTVKRENMKKAYAQVETVLTPAQDKIFKEKRDEMRKQWQQQQQQQPQQQDSH